MSVVRPRRSSDPDRVRLWVGVVLLIVTALALLAIIFAALQIQSGVRASPGELVRKLREVLDESPPS